MNQKTSVVTPERFDKGLTFEQYLASIKVNKDRFQENYEKFHIRPADASDLAVMARQPGGPAKFLVLGEDWCPDVIRGLPVAARMAEASGMELRIFPRDENLDIMNEFLNQGKFQSIPTCVFYTKDLQYIATWTERPALANRERAEFEARFKGLPEQEMRAKVRELTQPRWPAWQHETVWEIIELLKKSRTK